MTHRDLWAPWRMAYLRELEASEAACRGHGSPTPSGSSNFLLAAWNATADDAPGSDAAFAAHHVVFRNEHGLIMLNRYPYSNGHVLIALGDPRSSLMAYTTTQRAEFWALVDHAVALVEAAFEPQGFNVGLNQGRAAGAGVPEHLHAHVVPRWNGDTNFMATIGDVRVIPDALDASWTRLRDARSASLACSTRNRIA
ncbi:MAG: HIT domain-containing protein [Phycisphaerales bacterium]|nr:HIT domain-containing protein [Phycisphaerales bacterium]